MARKSSIERKTTETNIKLKFAIDGQGKGKINTGIPFLDHMLTLFAKHGLFDLTIDAVGDLEIDYHHTVEDIGIVLGKAIAQAVGDKKGIRRYGSALIPMDETLASVALDISGTPRKWVSAETAVGYYARDLVAFEFGNAERIYRGGWQRSGKRSQPHGELLPGDGRIC